MVAQYEPALQAPQDVDPSEAWKVPAPQLEHALAPAPEYFPVAHCAVTAERPVVVQYEPEPSTKDRSSVLKKHLFLHHQFIPSCPTSTCTPKDGHTRKIKNKITIKKTINKIENRIK